MKVALPGCRSSPHIRVIALCSPVLTATRALTYTSNILDLDFASRATTTVLTEWQPFRIHGRWLGWLPVMLLLAVSGCSGGDSGVRLPVSGKVKFRGQSLPFGTIEFQSTKAVGGGPIRGGAYEIAAEHGLPPGVYQVTISSIKAPPVKPGPPGPDAKDAGEELIPPEFNVKCDKTVEVRRGTPNQFNFDIP